MSDDFDVSLLHLALYVVTMGVIVEATYQKLKLLWERTRPKPVSKRLDQITANRYGPGMVEEPGEPEYEEVDPKDEIIPVVVGILVVLAFYPHSIFGYMPFHPQWYWLDVLLTALIVSRGANLAHETYRDFGGFVSGLVGRISRFGSWY